MRRLVSSLLTLILVFSLVPATVLAEPLADLAISVATDPFPGIEGEPMIAVVTVSNNGPDSAELVRIIIGNAWIISSTSSMVPTQGLCFGRNHSRFGQCDLGSLAAGFEASVSLFVASARTDQLLGAEVLSDATGDPNRANNTAKPFRVMSRQAKLAISAQIPESGAILGEPFVYTITIVNTGPHSTPDSKLILHDYAGERLIPSQGSCQDYSNRPWSGGELGTCNLGPISVNGVVTIQVTHTVVGYGTVSKEAQIRNSASAGTPDTVSIFYRANPALPPLPPSVLPTPVISPPAPLPEPVAPVPPPPPPVTGGYSPNPPTWNPQPSPTAPPAILPNPPVFVDTGILITTNEQASIVALATDKNRNPVAFVNDAAREKYFQAFGNGARLSSSMDGIRTIFGITAFRLLVEAGTPIPYIPPAPPVVVAPAPPSSIPSVPPVPPVTPAPSPNPPTWNPPSAPLPIPPPTQSLVATPIVEGVTGPWPLNSVFLSGTADPRTTVYARSENTGQVFSATAYYSGAWFIFDIPFFSDTTFVVWAEKNGVRSGEARHRIARYISGYMPSPTPPVPSAPPPPPPLQVPAITAPTDLFMWPLDTVYFTGRGTPGATVFVNNENTGQLFSGTVHTNGNWYIDVPVVDGVNRYRVWAKKDNQKSRALTFELTRGTYFQRLQVATGERLEDSAFWRVVKGDPEDLNEFALSMGMDVVVIGDIRDVVKEAHLFVVNDPNFSPAVFGLAALGILTTGEPNDVLVSATKNVYKAVAKLAKRSVGAAGAVLKTAKAIHALGNGVSWLEKWSAMKTLLKLVLEDSARLIKYVDTHGAAGVELIQKAGKWVGVKTERFPDFNALTNHFKLHFYDTGVPWLGRAFNNADEYLEAAKSVISNPNAKRVLYYHRSNLNDPTLGYLLEKAGKVFLVAVNEAGEIKTFHNLSQGWGYVREGGTFGKLFKLDSF